LKSASAPAAPPGAAFKDKVDILPRPAPVLRNFKKLAAVVVREESEKSPVAPKVHASFTKFQRWWAPGTTSPRVPTTSSWRREDVPLERRRFGLRRHEVVGWTREAIVATMATHIEVQP
jgi:hypothetical protein